MKELTVENCVSIVDDWGKAHKTPLKYCREIDMTPFELVLHFRARDIEAFSVVTIWNKKRRDRELTLYDAMLKSKATTKRAYAKKTKRKVKQKKVPV